MDLATRIERAVEQTATHAADLAEARLAAVALVAAALCDAGYQATGATQVAATFVEGAERSIREEVPNATTAEIAGHLRYAAPQLAAKVPAFVARQLARVA